MIKFTSFTNQEIKQILSKEDLEIENFKNSILSLLEKTLVIKKEGDYNHAMMTSEIDGKEMFIEALMDFLSEKDNNKTITYLESLKQTNKDWKSIDDKIEEIKIKNSNSKFLKENSAHVEQIKTFINKYSSSEDFNEILEEKLKTITDYNVAELRVKVASLMLENEKFNDLPKGRIKTLINKTSFRSKQLQNLV